MDLYILGSQPAHSSLWCMKAQLLGSYMLYGVLLIYGGRQTYPHLLWILGAVVLFSGNAAAARLTDAASVLFGAIVAYHMRFINPHRRASGVTNASLIAAGLLLCSYPTFGPTTPWAHFMLNIGRVVMQYDVWGAPVLVSHQKGVAAMWHTLGACMVVFAVSRLEARDRIFSHWVLQWAGTHSFALFVIHPLIFWTVGVWAFLATQHVMLALDLTEFADPVSHLTFLMVSLPVVVVLCRIWYEWIDVRLFKYLQRVIPDPGERWWPSGLVEPSPMPKPPTSGQTVHMHAHAHARKEAV